MHRCLLYTCRIQRFKISLVLYHPYSAIYSSGMNGLNYDSANEHKVPFLRLLSSGGKILVRLREVVK